MKKTLLAFAILGLSTSVMAQEAADKNVQAGLVVAIGPNFQNMGTKIVASDGAGLDLTIGMNANWAFNENLGFNTGVEFDFSKVKYKTSASEEIYYWYNDSEILQQEDVADAANPELYKLSTRAQRGTYLTIPTMLLFRTNFIGYFRYFGKFGLRNSFLLTSKIDDTGVNYDNDIPGDPVEIAGDNLNMRASGDMFFFKSAVGLAGGAEWNFSGSTSLVAELGFYYGFTPLHLNRNEGKTTLFTAAGINGTAANNNFSNQATQQQLQFKVSILF
ncbi:MAG: outer membrane beta-barrel protein [Crocinitomicaceae bacterium]